MQRHLLAHGPHDLSDAESETGMQLPAVFLRTADQRFYLFQIRSVDIKIMIEIGRLAISVNAQILSHAAGPSNESQRNGPVDRILRHPAIGRPLASDDRDQVRPGHHNFVTARNFLRTFPARFRGGQRTKSGEHGQHVLAPGTAAQVTVGRTENEIDLLLQRTGFDRRVGRADHHVVMPRNGEQHTAVIGFRDHHGLFATKELSVEHQMDSLTGTHQMNAGRVVHLKDRIDENARRIDNGFRIEPKATAAFEIDRLDARKPAVGLEQLFDPDVIDRDGSVLDSGLSQIDRHARIVELPVMIQDTAPQLVGGQRGNRFQRAFAAQIAGPAEGKAAGHQVVKRQPDSVKRSFPPSIARNDERLVPDQMRRVAAHQPPLLERLEHQPHVALSQIANASVYELRTFARRRFGKIGLLQQSHPESARSRIDGDSQPGSAPSDHDEIPRALALQPFQQLVPIHTIKI